MEQFAIFIRYVECAGEQVDRIAIRRFANPTLQRTDRLRADSRVLGEGLLRKTRCKPQTLEQRSESGFLRVAHETFRVLQRLTKRPSAVHEGQNRQAGTGYAHLWKRKAAKTRYRM